MSRDAIRYLSYPIVLGVSALTIVALADRGVSYWPAFPIIVLLASVTVGILERILPFEEAWNRGRGDLATDLLHNLVNHALIQITVAGTFLLRAAGASGLELWPVDWAMGGQILLAGIVLDLGLYGMHRLSHSNRPLWRLHAIHHSAERLYWLNSERRHPVSAVALAAPGLLALWIVGATPEAVGAWFAILTIHLAFQHSNLDYRIGSLRWLVGVAEVHRWHHKREYEDAQVNFGEFWMIWDVLFGTFHPGGARLRDGEVGLRDRDFPSGYAAQIRWPFRLPAAKASPLSR